MRTQIQAGHWKEAEKELRELSAEYHTNLSEAPRLSPETFEIVILGACKARQLVTAEDLLDLALRTIYYPTFQTFLALINAALIEKKTSPEYWIWDELRRQKDLPKSNIDEKDLQIFKQKKKIQKSSTPRSS